MAIRNAPQPGRDMVGGAMPLVRSLALASLVGLGCSRPGPAPGGPPASPPVASPGAPAGSRALAHGVTVREAEIERQGTPMTVWIYRPAPSATGRRPAILIAPAGTPLIWGVKLRDADRAEHLPWAERGYVVVAYSLDGPVEDSEDVVAIREGTRAF